MAFQDDLDLFGRLDVMDSVPLNTLDTCGAKHSPRRFRLGGPEGPFRRFQRKKVMVRSTLLEDFALAGPKGRFGTSNAKK